MVLPNIVVYLAWPRSISGSLSWGSCLEAALGMPQERTLWRVILVYLVVFGEGPFLAVVCIV